MTIAPATGDPDDYLVLELADGTRVRAHQHLRGERARRSPSADDYCWADPAALASRSISPAQHVGLDGDEVARRMLGPAARRCASW